MKDKTPPGKAPAFPNNFIFFVFPRPLLKRRRHLGQQLADFQMLRTDSFAFGAADAFRGLTVAASGQTVFIVIFGVPTVKSFPRVQGRKHIRYQDCFWTLIFLNAIAAGRTGNQI